MTKIYWYEEGRLYLEEHIPPEDLGNFVPYEIDDVTVLTPQEIIEGYDVLDMLLKAGKARKVDR